MDHLRKFYLHASAAIKNPTNPDSAIESSANSTADPILTPSNLLGDTTISGAINSLGDPNWEVFDPLNWVLDGLL